MKKIRAVLQESTVKVASLVIVLCVYGAIVFGSSIIFKDAVEFEQLRPEIVGLFFDGILFVGILGIVQTLLRKKDIQVLKISLNAPVENLVSELLVRFIPKQHTVFLHKARKHRIVQIDRQVAHDVKMDSKEKEKFKEVAENNRRILESVVPAAAHIGGDYIIKYLEIIEILDLVVHGREITDKTTVAQIIYLAKELGIKIDKVSLIRNQLRKSSYG